MSKCWSSLRTISGTPGVLAQAAVTNYHKLGSLNNKHFFLQFWRLEVQGQGIDRLGC